LDVISGRIAPEIYLKVDFRIENFRDARMTVRS